MDRSDASTLTAACLRYLGKDLFSLQDSLAYVTLLTAVLLTLEERGAVMISNADNALHARLRKEMDLREHPHLQVFLDAMPIEEPAMDFFERELKHRSDRREVQQKAYDFPPHPVVEDFLRRVDEESMTTDDRIAILLLWETQFAVSLWDASRRPFVEETVQKIQEEDHARASWAESIASIWMMRFVQS